MNAENNPVTEPDSKAAAEAAALKNASSTKAAPVISPGTAEQAQATPAVGNNMPDPDLAALTREELEDRVKTLTGNVASANAEAESFRQQWQDLRLRDEALGVEALTGDQAKIEDKVVQAVKELYQSEMKRREALQLLDKLLTSTSQLLQTAPNFDPKVRADYEVSARAAREYLSGHGGASIPLAGSISDAQVADVNPQLNAVILNVGKSEGVKEGMVFRIFQGAQQVGIVKVMLARDLICEALVQSLAASTVIKRGDRAEVETGQ